MSSSVRFFFAIFAVSFVAACPGSLENPDRFSGVTCTLAIDVETDIFVAKCGGGNCHGASASPAAGLDLESADLVERLVDVPGRSCNGRALIQSQAPDGSQMIDRVGEMPECGPRMPFGGQALSIEEQNCVRAWVFDVLTGSTSSALSEVRP